MMRPLGGRERLHREGVDLLPHTVSQCAVNDLVALNARLSVERSRDDHGLKVRTIAFDRKMVASEFFADICLYCFWGDHGAGDSLTNGVGWEALRATTVQRSKKVKL